MVVDGAQTTGMSRAQTSRLRLEKIGIVFQQSNLIASLTATEQLQVMAHLDGRSPRSGHGRAVALLETVGLANKATRRPHELSGGERQRVNIARALMNDPAVLLVDEPTSALDHERGAAIIKLLHNLTVKRGTATILVTHDHANLHRADEVIELIDGRVTRQSAPTSNESAIARCDRRIRRCRRVDLGLSVPHVARPVLKRKQAEIACWSRISLISACSVVRGWPVTGPSPGDRTGGTSSLHTRLVPDPTRARSAISARPFERDGAGNLT